MSRQEQRLAAVENNAVIGAKRDGTADGAQDLASVGVEQRDGAVLVPCGDDLAVGADVAALLDVALADPALRAGGQVPALDKGSFLGSIGTDHEGAVRTESQART